MYLDFKDGIDEEKIIEIAKEIKNGKVVVFPTETVYGIGTNCYDEEAIKRIYKVKNRPIDKAISVLVSDYEMIKDIALEINEIEEKIIKAFMPGPLTIILKKKNKISDLVTAGKDTVGVRMPDNEVALKLIKNVGCPIATPSANISGKESGIRIDEIMNDFGQNVDYYIDTGKSKLSLSSTIVKVVDNNIEILREGIISKEEIEKIVR